MLNIRRSVLISFLCLNALGCGGTVQRQEHSGGESNAETQSSNLETHWQLQRFADTAEAPWPSGTSPTLHLQQGRVEGSSGCNRYFGDYRLQGQQIRINLVGSTKMACADNRLMELEQRYFEILGQTASYRIESETLLLLDERADPLAIFAPAAKQSH